MRNLRYQEADGDIMHTAESWAHKTYSFIDMLAWCVGIMTIFTIIAIAMNYHLSCELAKTKAHIKSKKDG